ncbi:hypothetical protein J2S71_001137 [Olsenella profusa DSM 13989]|uniref:DUF2877 domain-containing protein n=1 Tax=Olsenella profusa TaxID=138595 RepID=UPI002789BA9E|nr:DUF2877 domain-containing protein [Olsenella profusa]MDP9859441.1 hypothetical protein [Olsenella profusa DSM 13989]
MGTQARISSSLVPLGGDSLAGVVVQAFAHGMDVQPDQGRLFYVGGHDRPLSCIGLQLPQGQTGLLLDRARIGDEVRITSRGLFLTRGSRPLLRLVWTELETVRLSLTSQLSPEGRRRVASAVAHADPPLSPGLAIDTSLLAALRGLAVGEAAREDAIFWLLGRGLGLTPSGDDILSGFGLGLRARGDEGDLAAFAGALQRMLLIRHTTPVSEAYLAAMLEGTCNEGFLELLEAAQEGRPLEGALAGARSYGHTSGDDMLLGLYAAFARRAPSPSLWGWGNSLWRHTVIGKNGGAHAYDAPRAHRDRPRRQCHPDG